MRAENRRMQEFLQGHGLKVRAKRIHDGSLSGTWRIYSLKQNWTPELAEQFNRLGFVDFDGEALSWVSGNGGLFSVFVRGHNELASPSGRVDQ